jgi:hypothetical protein
MFIETYIIDKFTRDKKEVFSINTDHVLHVDRAADGTATFYLRDEQVMQTDEPYESVMKRLKEKKEE